jgi:uncharacterized protein (DUF1684 family)
MIADINEIRLLDWKRRIFDLYARVRTMGGAAAWYEWRTERDLLFKKHPCSPIPEAQRAAFTGLAYHDYDPTLRVVARLDRADRERIEIATSGDAPYAFIRVGTAGFELAGESQRLSLFWLKAYGGGLFMSFRDATSGGSTYGAGRYLLDTVKGADLGMEDKGLVLDFNFAYNPSCSYDPRWVCPLAPPENRLEIPIEAGERSG